MLQRRGILRFLAFVFKVKRSRYYIERDMLLHEITIYKIGWDRLSLKSLNRDLDCHREGDLPASREWYKNGNLKWEIYYRNGLKHREGELPALRLWYGKGILLKEAYYLWGDEYDPT